MNRSRLFADLSNAITVALRKNPARTKEWKLLGEEILDGRRYLGDAFEQLLDTPTKRVRFWKQVEREVFDPAYGVPRASLRASSKPPIVADAELRSRHT